MATKRAKRTVEVDVWAEVPVYAPAFVLHIGDLDRPCGRRSFSHEGSGVSVSLSPDSWSEITSLAGSLWLIHRTDREPLRLVDYHKVSRGARRRIRDLAVAEGLLERVETFEMSYYDDEWERTFRFSYRTREEAVAERYEGSRIRRRESYEATAKLQAWWAERFTQEIPLGWGEEIALVHLAERSGRFDGVWWADDDDPVRLSAPRGVIFDRVLPACTRVRDPGPEVFEAFELDEGDVYE